MIYSSFNMLFEKRDFMMNHQTTSPPNNTHDGHAKLAGKMGILSILVVILLLGLTWVQSLVNERQNAQADVIRQIAASSSNSQTILGPILVIPYQYTTMENIMAKDEAGNVIAGKVIGSREVIQFKEWLILPKDLKVEGNAKVEARRLGIYQGQVYLSDLNISGSLPALDTSHLKKLNKLVVGDPKLTVLVGDTRGIQTLSALKLGAESFEFQAGSGIHTKTPPQPAPAPEVPSEYEHDEKAVVVAEQAPIQDLSNGVHIAFTGKGNLAAWETAQKFSFNLKIQGTESLAMVPVGESSSLTLNSNWADPNFAEQLSPSSREINQQGFKATWNSTWFANNLNTKLQNIDDLAKPNQSAFGVRFVKTVNEYQLNTRSVKYGVLFIVLTFVAFFVTEILKSLRVHPIQYFMIGSTLVLFYVLLLSLSEHFGFAMSYAIAAIMCVGLITLYSVFALQNKKPAVTMGILLSILYAVLYLILQSEDFALLSGSLLLFVVLGLMMFVTRNVNWYKDINLGLDTSALDKDPNHANDFDNIPSFEPQSEAKNDGIDAVSQDQPNTNNTESK